MRNIYLFGLIAFLISVLTTFVDAKNPIHNEPHPSLTPKDVVAIVMTALQRNDISNNDTGITITYSFASPANKLNTGPFERFAIMIKGGVYRQMLDNRSFELDNYEVSGKKAQVDVFLVSRTGKSFGFRFGLSKQVGNRYEGSWMTDLVVPIKITSV
jgi:hypothetical protein